MDSTDYLNTYPHYGEDRRLHNCNYLCLTCGALRRAPAHYVPNGPEPPQHCGSPMLCLSYQQTVAATHLTMAERVDWMRSGGQVREVGAKKKWRACKLSNKP